MTGGRSPWVCARWARFWIGVSVAIVAWLLISVALPAGAARLGAPAWPTGILAELRESARDGVLILLAFALVVPAFHALRRPQDSSWITPATPEALGATRAWIALILLASVVWEDLPSSAHLPRGMLDLDSHWLVGTLHALPIRFDRFLESWTALRVYEMVTAAILLLAAAGLFTRWTVPAGGLAYLVYAAILRSYAWSYHTGVIPLYAMLLLSFTRCGDGLSIDGWRRRRRGEAVPDPRRATLAHGLGRYLVWMGVAIPYTMAGLSKLRNTGFDWWRGEHLKQMVLATVVEPMHFDFQLAFYMLRGPGWVFDFLGATALVTEVTFVLVLASHLARMVLPALMAGTHVGILLMQNILFPDLIAIQAIFYNWAPLRDRVIAWKRVRAAPGRRALDRAATNVRWDVPPHATRESRVACGFLVLAFVVWSTRTEKFPLSAMQMFSRPVALGPVEYVIPIAQYEDGTRERARFERWIGAMADTRYRRLIRAWRTRPERTALLREFLDAAAHRANAGLPHGRRIRGFDLELRRWDFRHSPDDPQRGVVVAVFRHNVEARTSALRR